MCTLSAMVIKSTTAHIFHVGDARIYRLRGDGARAADRRSPCLRLAGAELPQPRARHAIRSSTSTTRPLHVEQGDVFLLATDGVHEHVDAPVHRRLRCSEHARRSRCGGQRRSSRRPTERGQQRQSHRADRRESTRCRRGMRARFTSSSRELPFPPHARGADDFRRLQDRAGAARQQPQPRLPRGRHAKPTCRWSSRRRRWICRATRPTWSDS